MSERFGHYCSDVLYTVKKMLFKIICLYIVYDILVLLSSVSSFTHSTNTYEALTVEFCYVSVFSLFIKRDREASSLITQSQDSPS